VLTHGQILGALQEAFPQQEGAQPSIRLVGRCLEPALALQTRTASVFVPDLHLLSHADEAFYARYHFTAGQDEDLQKALSALARLRDADPWSLTVYQLGDLFDFWRSRGGRDAKSEVDEIAASHPEIVDLLRDRLEAHVLAGNHDYVCHLLSEWRAARFFLVRGPSGGGDTLVLHGDELDWAEKLAPDAFQAWAVQQARGVVAPTQSFDAVDRDAAAAVNRSVAAGDAPIGPGLAVYEDPGVVGDVRDDLSFLFDLASVSIEDGKTRFFRQAERLATELEKLGHDVRCVVMGHTHGARIVRGRRQDGRELVLVDCGAWFGSSRFGAQPKIASAQLGVIVGNDLRIYQVGAREV